MMHKWYFSTMKEALDFVQRFGKVRAISIKKNKDKYVLRVID